MEKGKLLMSWLASRRYLLLYLLLLFALILCFAYLFGAQKTILAYQLSLFFLLSGLFLIFDFLKEAAKYTAILEVKELDEATASMSERLLFQQLRESREDYRSSQVAERMRREVLMDYFTLWAHQIKIPLTASRLLIAELPDKKGLDKELFKVEQYADLAMSYLRLEDFHGDLLLESHQIEDLVKATVKKYALFFIQQKIQLELGDLHYSFVTDKKWFMIILEQILSNSLKYTKSGKIQIRLDKDQLLISDTGIGIQSADIERVFTRGFSGYNGRLNQQSSGLGLYLSKTIADKLGHSLTLTSEVGRGTQVAIGLKQATLLED